MEARAIAKTLRVSPIKARLVVDLIRGKNANDALNILNNILFLGWEIPPLSIRFFPIIIVPGFSITILSGYFFIITFQP